MKGIVAALLMPGPFTMPKYFELARRDIAAISERYLARLLEMNRILGESDSVETADWYPAAIRMFSWRRNAKTISLILERHNRHGWHANLLWALRDQDIESLRQGWQSRAARVASIDEFRRYLRLLLQQMAERTQPMDLSISRHLIINDLSALAPANAIELLREMLCDSDGGVRCEAAEMMLRMEAEHGIPYVLPLFHDSLDWVRHNVLEDVMRYPDESLIGPLIEKLKTDTDPGVRGTAAAGLGRIGSPEAIPALVAALEDNELDALGHSPRSCSATALDELLGTNETRIKLDDGLCQMAPWKPDYERLKMKAQDLYRAWKSTSSR